ncbi:porin family protein [Aurantibacillus circumpalustris]|uniref:porin family protein n=1 Tax=Aurantibacillus circumpalustris TaxID=3036359 RepID=UPI00295C2466|nr:porin family protein [Aurantibacillus circumpalustris]
MRALLKKTATLVVIIVLVNSINVRAQTSIGVKIGANFAKMSFDDNFGVNEQISNSTLTDINVGIPFEIRFSKVIAIQPEINYIGKGTSQVVKGYQNNGTEWESYESVSKIRLGYMEVPFLLKLGVNKEKFGVNVLLGPSFGMLTRIAYQFESNSTNSSGQTQSSSDSESMLIGSQNFEYGFDVGANLGLEFSLPLGPGKLFTEARYQYSKTFLDGTSLTHMGIQGVIGYRIPFSAF